MADIHYLHGRPTPIEQFIRVGHSGHRQLEDLHASGRLPVRRAVFEAAYLPQQSDLIKALRGSGTEIVLDPNMAETTTVGRFASMAKTLEWANADRPWRVEDFARGANRETAKKIAQFSVSAQADAVLSPTLLLGRSGARDPWFGIGKNLCIDFREALDAIGGKDVAIDFQLMLPYGVLLDEAQRRAIVTGLRDIPFENLWIRTARFGRDATPAGFKRFAVGLLDFQVLGKPIVADGVGGLIGLGITSFGSVGAICHGVAERERFDTSSWLRPPMNKVDGGQARWIYFPQLDRLLDVKKARLLLETPGSRSFLACNDPFCCPNGPDDMLENYKGHFLEQRARQIADLARVPDHLRASHFIRYHLDMARRNARRAAKLKFESEEEGAVALSKILQENSKRLTKFKQVAETLLETLPETTRSSAPRHRAGRFENRASRGW